MNQFKVTRATLNRIVEAGPHVFGLHFMKNRLATSRWPYNLLAEWACCIKSVGYYGPAGQIRVELNNPNDVQRYTATYIQPKRLPGPSQWKSFALNEDPEARDDGDDNDETVRDMIQILTEDDAVEPWTNPFRGTTSTTPTTIWLTRADLQWARFVQMIKF